MFKPLVVPPQVTIKAEVDELDLNDLEGLDPDMVRVIPERVKAKLVKNRKHTCRALITYEGLFQQMYGSLLTLANVKSNSVCVYLKLFSVTDANQWTLVRSMMSSIFKPSVRQALNLNTSDSS